MLDFYKEFMYTLQMGECFVVKRKVFYENGTDYQRKGGSG